MAWPGIEAARDTRPERDWLGYGLGPQLQGAGAKVDKAQSKHIRPCIVHGHQPRSFCGRATRMPMSKGSGCDVGAGGVVAATCNHTTTGTGCAFRAIRQIRHNRVNNQTNQSVSECAKVGTKIAIVGVDNFFSLGKMAWRSIGPKSMGTWHGLSLTTQKTSIQAEAHELNGEGPSSSSSS